MHTVKMVGPGNPGKPVWVLCVRKEPLALSGKITATELKWCNVCLTFKIVRCRHMTSSKSRGRFVQLELLLEISKGSCFHLMYRHYMLALPG